MALNDNLEEILKIKDNNDAIAKLVSVVAKMQEKIEFSISRLLYKLEKIVSNNGKLETSKFSSS